MDENKFQLEEDVIVESTGAPKISPTVPDLYCSTSDVKLTERCQDSTCHPTDYLQPSSTSSDTSITACCAADTAASALEVALQLINEQSEVLSVSNDQNPTESSENSRISDIKAIPENSQTNLAVRRSIHNAPRRSSLTEDSRLVKISLPTNSINLIQSNTQFLNKSRNFLNFITEKSTNIMEKALLPQHIAVRYSGSDRKPLQDVNANKFGSMQNISAKSSEIPEFSAQLEHSTTDGGETLNKLISLASPLHSVTPESSSSVKMSISTQDLSVLSGTSNLTSTNGEVISETETNSHQICDTVHSPYTEFNIENFQQLREEKLILIERIKRLEQQNQQLEEENSPIEIENRDKTIERLTNELRMAILTQEELRKEYAAANKERESMVMKYAVGEKQLIDAQRGRDGAEKKVRELVKENELLQNKLKQTLGERTRICGILDTKCKELVEVQKELERLKEDISVKEVKLKWTQTKLKTEMEAQKDTQQKLDKALARINDMKEECEQVRRESQETIRKFQQSEENKAVTLDQQLKEQQARLILERHVTEDKEMLRLQLQKEVESLKNRQQVLIEENNTLSLKIQDLEKDRLNYESNISNLKILADQRQKEIVDLSSKVSHLETLKLQLIHKEQCLASTETEVERLRLVNQELQTDMDCCRQREAHMLEFTQKLTDKNVRLQSEFTAVEAKANQLEIEQGPLRESIVELKSKIKSLEESLVFETSKRIEECEILARHLAEQTQLAENLSQKLEDSQGENLVLKRKYQASIKEMTRELQQCRKKLEAYETSSPSKSLEQTPRTSSNTSLNTGDTSNGVSSSENSTNGESPLPYNDLDKNSLIERILKMQKINVRRAEKLDFLEEHTRALVAELQKKTKIIQNYILHENFDAMGSNERDRYKAELARHGGIMASVYNHRVSDDNMTLELSLEINQKLQAVLEDALLKNITLKDNIDTLGEEIARLTIQNQQLQKSSK